MADEQSKRTEYLQRAAAAAQRRGAARKGTPQEAEAHKKAVAKRRENEARKKGK